MGFLAPSAYEAKGSDLHRVCLARLCYVSRLSQPPDVFFLPEPLQPCFMPLTLMGFPSSEVFPPDQPVRLSADLPLLTFLVDDSPSEPSIPSSSREPTRG